MMRQGSMPPMPPAGISSQASAARSAPKPKPDWRKPQPLGRARFGQVSATRATPVLHSDPMARPVTKRRAASMAKLVENAVSPVSRA